jgi:hypothetical protein
MNRALIRHSSPEPKHAGPRHHLTTLSDRTSRSMGPMEGWILQLQRTAGNHAVAELLRDRLPAEKWTGGPVPGGPARPLDPSVRGAMEQRFGEWFDDVQVLQSAASTAAVKSRAWTRGTEIVLGDEAEATRPRSWTLAHELTHVLQSRLAKGEETGDAGAAELEARRAATRVTLGLPAGSIRVPFAGLARTPTSAAITPLISYSPLDLEVTAAEERTVLAQLRADPDLSGTVRDLNAAGMLAALVDRIDEPVSRYELMQLLGSRLNAPERALVEPLVDRLDRPAQLAYNIARLGISTPAPPFPTAGALRSALVAGPSSPFSGLGATGQSPTTLTIPYLEQAQLLAGDPATTARFSNPLPGSLPAYLATLTAAQRKQQAELLVRQPISTVEPAAYPSGLPSRVQVMRAAAAATNLHPQLIAGFLLAEQRDQSEREDAKDFLAATSLARANTSIGLGQVVISTAQRQHLFSDLMDRQRSPD